MQGYDEPRGREFERRVLDKVRQMPGVESAALVDNLQLSPTVPWSGIYIEGKPVPKRASEVLNAYAFTVSPDYFHTMRTRLISGREFDDRDKPGGRRVAVVNSSFSARLLDGANPLGTPLFHQHDSRTNRNCGRRGDGKYYNLTEQAPMAFWMPLEIAYKPKACVVARTR